MQRPLLVIERATTLYSLTVDAKDQASAERIARQTYRRGQLQPLETAIVALEISGEAPPAAAAPAADEEEPGPPEEAIYARTDKAKTRR